MKSEQFGQLLKAGIASITYCERKTAPVVEADLGAQIGVEATTIQRYKAGHLPPELRTIEILADAIVKRGLLGREWLQRFLHAAQYPASDRLLDKLCPIGPVRPRPPRIYENLPAPTYSQFVMRQQAFAEIIEGLQQRSAVVLIASLGGMGKTSLAREVAACCLNGGYGVPQFDAVVWVSDKDHPGTTTFSIVLDEISRTLDYPGFTQFAHEEKRREVEQLLRRQKVLLVVDNFETITDGVLLSWLLRLPEPSKAIVTTREYRREFRRGGWPVDLRGMTEDEAKRLVDERVKVLKIEKFVGDLAQLEPLLVATGGNPKAIEMTMGLLKYERRPVQQILDDLYTARGELFDDLFARAWALLDEASRRMLMGMTFFPTSASREALRVTADVQENSFARAVERLADLALLDVQHDNLSMPPRYALHPLVRAFAAARLPEQMGFEPSARERWVEWYLQLTAQVGFCWYDLTRLDLLNGEEEAIYDVAVWASHADQHERVCRIAEGVEYFYYIRGIWDKYLKTSITHVEAARLLNDSREEMWSLGHHVQVLGRQGNVSEMERHIPRLFALREQNEMHIDANTLFWVYHAIALYHESNKDLLSAQQSWEYPLLRASEMSEYVHITNCYWLGNCLFVQSKWKEARELFLLSLNKAAENGYVRYVLFNQLRLAEIAIGQEDIEGPTVILEDINKKARQYQIREHIARSQFLYARLHTLRGDLLAARVSLAEAIDLFERLGMRRELAEAREEMARLEAQLAAPASP